MEDKYKNVIGELHKKLSILLRVISSCSMKVDHLRVCELTTDISVLIAEKLPWVDITPTLHGLLHHSSELIHLNGGWSLGTLSEEVGGDVRNRFSLSPFQKSPLPPYTIEKYFLFGRNELYGSLSTYLCVFTCFSQTLRGILLSMI